MKKSLLALLISMLFLTGCEDKTQTAQLQQAQTTIAQLKSELSETQKQLAQANDKLSAKAEFPTLRPKTLNVFSQTETLKFEKKSTEDEFIPEEGTVTLNNTLVQTGIEWLDQALFEQNVAMFIEQEQTTEINLTTFQAMLKQTFADRVAAIKKEPQIGDELSVYMNYLGQWNNIATFSQFVYSYTGGAHGMFSTDYLNFDVDKQKLITLNDLFSQPNRQKAKQLLWETYKARSAEENDQPFVEQKDFSLSEQFYFTPDGLVFSYPPYAIGPFVEGEIDLTLTWEEINELINPDYLLKPVINIE